MTASVVGEKEGEVTRYLEINGTAIQEHIGGDSSDGETEPTLEKNLLRKSGRRKKVRTKERRERGMCFRLGRVLQL